MSALATRARGPRAQHARDLSMLGIGSAIAGLLAYIIFAVTTRGLGATGAAPVAMLWTIWGLTTAAIGFPLQHWVAQSAARLGHTGGVRQGLPSVSVAVAGATVLVLAGCWLFGRPLFGEPGVTFPLLAAVLTLGTAVTGAIRGALSVQTRYSAVAVTLVLENAYRGAGVVALLAADLDSPTAYGLVVATGNLTILPWIGALRFDGEAPSTPERPLRFIGGVSGGQLLSQLVLTGGPVMLAVVGGAPSAVTILFIALSLYRAPYILAMGMVARLTGWFTAAVASGDTALLVRVRRMLLVATVVGGGAAAGVGATVGAWLLPVVFGPEIVLPSLPSAIIAAGSTIAVANLVLTVMVMAHGRTVVTTIGWVVALAVATALLLLPIDPTLRVSWGFLAAQAVAWVIFFRAVVPKRV